MSIIERLNEEHPDKLRYFLSKAPTLTLTLALTLTLTLTLTLPQVSSEAKAVVKALLSPSPAKRPSASQLMAMPWVQGERRRPQP